MSARSLWRGVNPPVRVSQSEALLFDRVVAEGRHLRGYRIGPHERDDADFLVKQELVREYEPGCLVARY